MKPYPAYKDSGVEWLGMVPEGWEMRDLKHLCHVFPSNVDKHSHPDETPVQLCNYTDVYYNDRITASMSFMDATATDAEIAKFSLRVGDVIFTKDSETADDIGVAAIVSEELPGVICGYHLSIARPNDGVDGHFIKAFFDSAAAKGYFAVSANGLTRVGLGQAAIDNLQIAIPPLPEQQAIAAFLDRETAKIDGLIEEQRRLIALLAEKRQATISHAVTRGLNPSAHLKPSGVDWLGDVPEGWEVSVVKTLVHAIEQGWSPQCEAYPADDGEWGVLKVGCVNGGEFRAAENKALPPELEPQPNLGLQRGDILVSRANTRELVGSVAMVPNDYPKLMLCDKLYRLRTRANFVTSEYLALGLQSQFARREIELEASGASASMVNIAQSVIMDMRLPIPPLSEQVEIVQFIRRASEQIDGLSEAANSAIALLQERRAALISAAVTGKISVRDALASHTQSRKPLSVRVLLGGVIIAALGRHPSVGRMLVQKHLFMAEAHAGVSELQGRYDRQAAGPYDVDLQHLVEADLVAAGLLRVGQDGGPGFRVEYEFFGDAAALRAELAVALGDRMARFDDTFHKLADLSKTGIEAVATLYAAWNDFLMDGKKPSRDDIIREVLENWHEEKRKKFTKADLAIWLDWMERHQILPTGTGPKTQTGRLFT